MMSLCKKSVHSFLGLANHPHNSINVISLDQQKPYSFNANSNTNIVPSCGGGAGAGAGSLGLMSATSDICKTPNVLESSTLKSTPSQSSCSSDNDFLGNKKDPGGGKIGFIDDIGGGVDGLMSCTESLGCESSDERRVDDEIELCLGQEETRSRSINNEVKWRYRGGGERSREAKKFPPPLSSLNQNGQPNFFLKPVRKDGRLELTKVRIDRPEVLRASRQDGRLRLHLVRHEEEDEEEEVDVNEQEEKEEMGEDTEVVEEEKQEQEEEEVEVVTKSIIDEKEAQEECGEEWGFVEGFRRCHEQHDYHHNHHHHYHHKHHNNHLHVWTQQCVPTR